MTSTTKKLLSLGGILMIALLLVLINIKSSSINSGSTAIPAQQNAESSTISGFFSESLATIGTFFQGGHNSDPLSVASYATVGTCADGSTTLFGLANPFSATSTAQLVALSGTDGTTTIDILVGTSTIATAPAGSNLASPTLLKATLIATSTPFYTSSGVAVGPGTGYTEPGTTNYTIAVGPSEYLVGQATSSYPGASATGVSGITNAANTFNCTYKVLWMK